MATLTTTQRALLQRYLGIGTGQTVLTNAELDENYTEAASDFNKTVVISLRQMLGDAHRFQTYTLGADGLNKQELFNNLERLLTRWERTAGMSGGPIRTATLDYGLDEPYDAEWS